MVDSLTFFAASTAGVEVLEKVGKGVEFCEVLV